MFLQTSITEFQLMFSTSRVGLYNWTGGLASVTATVPAFFVTFLFLFFVYRRKEITTL
jgi:hypothetical protein